MSEQEYLELWHYNEQFTRDKLQRSELLCLVWKAGEKFGERRTMGLMKSSMHFRAKEINKRSAVGPPLQAQRRIPTSESRRGFCVLKK